MPPLLRRPTDHDFNTIASWVPDAATCLRWAGPNVPFPFSGDQLPALLGASERATWCLGGGWGEAVGFGQYQLHGESTVHLSRIIVAPSERGSGVGFLLCTMLMTKAFAETGARAASVRVYRDNYPALAVYRKLGFLPVDAESDRDVQFMRTGDRHG